MTLQQNRLKQEAGQFISTSISSLMLFGIRGIARVVGGVNHCTCLQKANKTSLIWLGIWAGNGCS